MVSSSLPSWGVSWYPTCLLPCTVPGSRSPVLPEARGQDPKNLWVDRNEDLFFFFFLELEYEHDTTTRHDMT